MRSRYAHKTSSTARSGSVASDISCCGVSTITSCAPTPFILSNSPSPSRSSSPSIPSAGNRFGTTRMLHPDEFAPPPLRPYAKISGGVLFSAPGQNGQPRGPAITTLSRTKSIGRLPRSVEMITQRAVIGSFRSSGTAILLDHARGRQQRREHYLCSEIVPRLASGRPCQARILPAAIDSVALPYATQHSGWTSRPTANAYHALSCGLNASLCSRNSGGSPVRLSIATTSNRQGHSFTCLSPRNRNAVRTTFRCLSVVTLNSGNPDKSPSRTVRVRTSTNASVSPSYPIRSISPFGARGEKFRAMNTYPAQRKYQYA